MRPSPALAVIVPALNGRDVLPQLLDALERQDRPPDELIVVKGGAVDSVRDCVERYALANPGVSVRLIPNPTGTIPAALNLGISAARSEVIARMDEHARPAPDYLRRCLDVLETSKAGVIGGRWEILPGASGLVAGAIALTVGHPLGAGDARYRLPSAEAGDVDTVPYGCFRKALWQRLGGFNEALLSNEDYEFNWRVRAAGGRVHFDPAIRTSYPARPTLRALARQYFRYGWWKVQMLRRHPGSLRWRQAAPVLALGVLGLSVALSFVIPLARLALAGLVVTYLLLSGGASLQLAIGARSLRWMAALPLAFATVHLAWGAGAWLSLLTAGRWPTWPGQPSAGKWGGEA